MSKLTKRQAKIFQYILGYYKENGLVPDYPEIMERFNFKHSNSVYQYFEAFIQKNFLIKRDRGWYDLHPRKIHLLRDEEFSSGGIPIKGRIAASGMQEAIEEDIGSIPVSISVTQRSRVFGLQVTGPSMTNAGIEEGDYILLEDRNYLKNGEIGAIRYNGETSLKTIYQEENRMILEPQNSRFSPIIIEPGEFEKITIIGKYIGKARKDSDGWHLFLKA